MPQTRMFRDRVVSMEQTLEGGEKQLELLKRLLREALPEFEYTGHVLDHERDLFVMVLKAPDGRRKTVAWTRMVLFDAERIPAITSNPVSPVRDRLISFLKSRASRPEIVVTFRHLEEGWVDTPEARPPRRRGRRGSRGGKGSAAPQTVASARGAPPGRPGGGPLEGRPPGQLATGAVPQPASVGSAPGRSSRRRRSRRRRGGPGPGPQRTP